jgi:hypothetical protein
MPLNTPRLSRCLLHLARNPSTALSQDAEACAYAGERMTERRYAHLAPSYIGKTIRAAFGNLDLPAAD